MNTIAVCFGGRDPMAPARASDGKSPPSPLVSLHGGRRYFVEPEDARRRAKRLATPCESPTCRIRARRDRPTRRLS